MNKQEDWEKEAKELADKLEIFCGERKCKVCGNEPEEQMKKISKQISKAYDKGWSEGIEKVEKILTGKGYRNYDDLEKLNHD